MKTSFLYVNATFNVLVKVCIDLLNDSNIVSFLVWDRSVFFHACFTDVFVHLGHLIILSWYDYFPMKKPIEAVRITNHFCMN